MSCALTRRNCSSPHDRFDDDCHSSISICDKLLSIPNGLSGRIGSKLRRLDLKLGKFLVELTAEIEKVQNRNPERSVNGVVRKKGIGDIENVRAIDSIIRIVLEVAIEVEVVTMQQMIGSNVGRLENDRIVRRTR